HGEVARRSRGERLCERDAASVIEDQRLPSLREARRLQYRNLPETSLVDLDSEAAREERNGLLQLRRISIRKMPYGGKIRLEPRMIERGLVEVLGGAHEHPRPAAHGIDQRAVGAARLRREEDEQLPCLLRHLQCETFCRAAAR